MLPISALRFQYILTLITDSDQWVVLSLWKMGDYKAARGLDASPYWVKLPGLALFNYLIDIVELCGEGVPADCGRVG
jgi:hypothetical protein